MQNEKTFPLLPGYYVTGYQTGSDRALALTHWQSLDQGKILLVKSELDGDIRIASFQALEGAEYPIDGPIAYPCTQKEAQDPYTTWEAADPNDSAQEAAIAAQQDIQIQAAMAAAQASGSLASDTAKQTAENTRKVGDTSFWSHIPWWVWLGGAAGLGIGIKKAIAE